MMKRNFLVICFSLCGFLLFAQNPITPSGFYLSDPAAHQDKNGMVYVYGSRDETPDYYCSRNYDIMSTDDLLQWSIHRDVFSTIGKKDAVAYTDEILYAPDCIAKDGLYYLYYCLSGGGDDEGVAMSHSPVGPFKHGQKMKGIRGIDPSVFVDDDGQAYISWGQFEAKVAKLKPNMMEVDTASIHTRVITESEHHFHEGSQLVKRNGIYYLIYAHIGRHGRPTCIGYSTASSPFGPYQYGGVIVDNWGCDPYVWNNHGSIAEINGKWYVFYHRSTEGGDKMRKACVEPISFNSDGSIDEVEMTTQGANGPLNPFQTMGAERACYLHGHVRVHCEEDGNELLDEIRNDDSAEFRYFNFKHSPKGITVSVKSTNGGKIQILANNLNRPLLATLDVPASDGEKMITLHADITQLLEGVHPVFFRFFGEKECDLFSLDSFRFE